MDAKPLPKTLGLGDVFCISAGAMVSAGIFLLPAAAFSRVGPAIAFSYVLGGVLATCGILAVLELATAMPAAGGIYYFTTRALGPLAGTMSGLFNWAALSLKSAFAIWGTAQLAHGWVPDVPAWTFGVGLTLAFLLVNLLSTAAAAKLEQLLVWVLLAIMAVYVALGLPHIESERFTPWLLPGVGPADVFWAAGFIFVSFGGLLGVVSVAEEVKDPRRNLPLGILAGLAVVTVLYGLVMGVTVGAIPAETLSSSSSPLADAARVFYGRPGHALLTAGALLAFVTTGNAGLMGAARYPVALARDRYAPCVFAGVWGGRRIPGPALLLTGAVVAAVQFMGIETLVTVASTVVMLSYILTNLSVIILRESRVMNYRPSFRTPFYPALPIACMSVFALLVVKLGDTALGLTYVFVGLSLALYFCYGLRVKREFALQQLVRRLFAPDAADGAVPDLERELLDVVRSRDGLVEDAFDRAVEAAPAFVEEGSVPLEDFFRRAAEEAAPRLGLPAADLAERLVAREKLSSTVIAPGVAVPHVLLRECSGTVLLLLAKCEGGVAFGGEAGPDGVRTAVFLFCSPDRRDAHLRALARIAQATMGSGFARQWAKARTPQQLRDVFLLAKRARRRP